jgi:hypothetical protein
MTLDVQAQDAAGFTGSVTIEPGQLFNSSISGRFVGGMLRSGRFRYQFREAGRRATLQWRRLEDGEVLQGRVTFRQRHQFRTNGTFLVRKDAPPATTP